jgi:hypothetical protein
LQHQIKVIRRNRSQELIGRGYQSVGVGGAIAGGADARSGPAPLPGSASHLSPPLTWLRPSCPVPAPLFPPSKWGRAEVPVAGCGRLGDREGGHWRGAEYRDPAGVWDWEGGAGQVWQCSDGCTVVSVCSEGTRVLRNTRFQIYIKIFNPNEANRLKKLVKKDGSVVTECRV